LAFKSVTLVPYEPHLINYTMISPVHVRYLYILCVPQQSYYLVKCCNYITERTYTVPVCSIPSRPLQQRVWDS